MFCTKCGQRLDDNAKFCTSCGSPVQAINVVPQAPVMQAAPVMPPVPNYVAPPAPAPVIPEAPVAPPAPATPVAPQAPNEVATSENSAPTAQTAENEASNKKVPKDYQFMFTSVKGDIADSYIYLNNDINGDPIFEPADGNNIIRFRSSYMAIHRMLYGTMTKEETGYAFDADIYITDSRIIINIPTMFKKDPTKVKSGHIRYEWVGGITYEKKRAFVTEHIGINARDGHKTNWDFTIEVKKGPDADYLANEIIRRLSIYKLRLDYPKYPEELTMYTEYANGKKILDRSENKTFSGAFPVDYFYAPSGIGYSMERHKERADKLLSKDPKDMVNSYRVARIIDSTSGTRDFEECAITPDVNILLEPRDGQNVQMIPINHIFLQHIHPADKKNPKTLIDSDAKAAFLIVTDSRVCIIYKDYNNGSAGRVFSSGFLTDIVVNATLGLAEDLKRGRKALVSQIRYEWVTQIIYENKDSQNKSNVTQFTVIDHDDNNYIFRVTFDKNFSPIGLTNDICKRLAICRLNMTDEKAEGDVKTFTQIAYEGRMIKDDGQPGRYHGFNFGSYLPAPTGKEYHTF